jgi:hypothetical protein
MDGSPCEIVVTRRAGGSGSLLLGGFALCMITGIAFWFGWAGVGDRANRDDFPLVIRAEDMDFGEAFMQEEFPWQLQIENTSAHPVRVLDFGSSCACTSINPSSVVVPGRGTASIELVLDTTGNWKDGEVDHPRAFAIDLWPILQGPRRPVPRWTIKGRVSRPLAFSPPAVLYGETLVQGRHLPEKTVLVRASEGVERLAIDCACPSVRLEAGLSDSSGNGWFEITISPGEQAPPVGRFEVDVRVIGVLSDGQRLPPVPLRLAGLVVPEFYAIPHTICLTPVSQGEPATVDVVLQSRVDGEFAVEQVVGGASGVVIEPQHTGLGRVHKLRAARVAPSSDSSENTITFLVRTDTGERKHVDVTVVEIP